MPSFLSRNTLYAKMGDLQITYNNLQNTLYVKMGDLHNLQKKLI